MAGRIHCKGSYPECQATSVVREQSGFPDKNDIPGIAGIDTRALTKILREKGTMNGMITTNENYNIEEIIPKLKAYTTGNVVDKVTCEEKASIKRRRKTCCTHGFRRKKQYCPVFK